MCVTKATGNESVLNLLETRKTRLAARGTETIPSITNQSLVAFQTIISRKIH